MEEREYRGENASVSVNGHCDRFKEATKEFHKEVNKNERGEKKRS